MKKLILIYTLLLSTTIFAQNWGEQILTQPNAASGNAFGYSVSIDGDYAVIGSPGENQITGSAHVFKRDGNGNWNYLQKLTAYVGQAIDEYFGSSVKIQGDYIFISSPTDRLNEELFQTPVGSVFIYKNNGADNFVGHQRLRASDASHGDYFGHSIDVSGDFLIAGALFEDQDQNGLNTIASAGSAYIFKKGVDNTWSQVQKIVPSQRGNRHYFGTTVAIDGNFLIVYGNDRTDENNLNNAAYGSVFIFKKDDGLNTWTEIQKLKTENYTMYSDIDISGNYIAVGANNEVFDDGKWYNGYTYIFKKSDIDDTWSQNQIVRISNSNEFGKAITMDSDFLLISDPYETVRHNGANVSQVGKSYLYKRAIDNNYELKETIVASKAQTNSFIGTGTFNSADANYATSISGNYFMLGAPYYDREVAGVTYLTSGAVFASNNINNVLSEDIVWTGNESDDWNDPLNWFPNTVPQSTNDVILENVANAPNIANGQNHIINNLTSFENLTVETNASLTIEGNIDQRAQITVNSAIDSNGSLIVNGNQTNPNPSNTTYNRYVSGNGNAWHLITSPISNVDIDNFAANEPLTNGQGNNRGLSWYNNINQTWEYYQADAVGSGNFPSGKGYAINTSANTTLEFTGILNASVLENYPITVNGNGWNLVGNPYAAFLYANANANATNFLTTNVGQLDPIAANVYVWNPTLSSYETIGNGDEAKYLAPGQAFFIKSKAGGGTIDIDKSMQTHRAENLFFKSTPAQKMVLEIKNGEKISRSTIAFKKGMSNDLDISYDAAVFSGVTTNFSLYTQLLENYENAKFAVQFLPELKDDTVIIPVGILLNEEKELTLKLYESSIDKGYKVYLEDRLLNIFRELSPEDSYTFNHNLQSNGLGRFYVHVQNGALNVETAFVKSFQAYKVDQSTIKVQGIQNGALTIYDITGKQILRNLKINQINQTVKLPKISSGVYILQIEEINGGKLTKKMIF